MSATYRKGGGAHRKWAGLKEKWVRFAKSIEMTEIGFVKSRTTSWSGFWKFCFEKFRIFEKWAWSKMGGAIKVVKDADFEFTQCAGLPFFV